VDIFSFPGPFCARAHAVEDSRRSCFAPQASSLRCFFDTFACSSLSTRCSAQAAERSDVSAEVRTRGGPPTSVGGTRSGPRHHMGVSVASGRASVSADSTGIRPPRSSHMMSGAKLPGRSCRQFGRPVVPLLGRGPADGTWPQASVHPPLHHVGPPMLAATRGCIAGGRPATCPIRSQRRGFGQ
jgi:hypothetical protein